jgi:hypothetical protein
MENLRRSKSFLADLFFPPYNIKEGNLKRLLNEFKDRYED